jgi:hypothetical protein
VRRRVISSIVSFALSLSLLTALTVVTAPPASANTTGTGSGLFALIKNGVGDYGSIPTDMKFSDRCGSTILTTVDFDWSTTMPTGAADCGTSSGGFRTNVSAMITGYLLAPATGTFTFKSRNDDGFVVNINGQTVISSWASQGVVAAPNFNTNNASSASMSLVAGNIYPIRIFFSQGDGRGEAYLYWNYGSSGDQIIPQSNLGLTASDLGTGCAVGESQFCPADNARQIKALTGTTSNQKWWINVGGVSTNTYALMDSNVDGGGWMMGMKGLTNAQGNSTALAYDATQWTTTTTLQAGSDNNAPLASDNANGKNNVFNYSAATEALVIWRDLTGRSDGYRYTNAGTYGFTWKESLTSSTGWSNAATGGVNSSGGCPTTAVTLLVLFTNANRCKLRDANSSSPYDARGNTVFSSQTRINFYGFNYYGSGEIPFKKVRFGFGWNENEEGNEGSNDVNGGIGMGGSSTGAWGAGDFIGCCQSTTGINRQAGFEFYVRNSALTISGTSSVTAIAGTASNPWTVSSASASTGASAARYIVKTRTPGVNTSAITINNSGVMSVSTALTGGTYSLDVSMIDTYGQVASTPVTLTVADASLTSLSISSGTLSPDFASATTSYTATVAHTVSSITATPTAVKSNATYKTNVNSAGLSSAINSGTTSGSLALNYGSNTILIVVTDVNGTTTKTYTLTVTRETSAPGAPTLGTATVTNATTVSIPFTAGAANGSAITSYTITSSPSLALSYSGTTSPFTVTGSFVEGQAYTFTMTATNEVGTSSPSSASNSITPNNATAPTLSTAVLNSAGTQITLTYNETLSATTAATSAFAVSDSGTAVTVSSVTASGFTVTLALASTINIGRVVTVSYTDPTAGDDASAIQDSVGNDAISLASRSVTNDSTVKATPTFSSWSNVTKTFGDANYSVTAPTVTGSLAGSFSYSSSNTGVISISGTTFTVQGGGSATITATFTPTDTTNYNSATTTNTVTVNKASQSAITITTTNATYGTNLTLASTGGSTGGSYSYTKVSGNCTLSGAVLTPTATGSCVVQSSLATTTNYLAETSTATTITISSGTVSASLTLAPGNLTFRQAKNIAAVATVAGKITFRVAGKVLPGCKNKTVNAGNSFTTTCSYRPSNHSYVTISATLNPTDSYYTGTVTNSAQYLVTRRTGAR